MKKTFTILVLVLLLGTTRVFSSSPYTVSVTTALGSFGDVVTNTTAGPNSFGINIQSLGSVIVPVAALNGFTYCATSGGTYTTTLSLSSIGGSVNQTVYVKFTPTAVQSYNGNIVVGSTTNVAASGSGISNVPPITSFTPATASMGTTVTITGTSFTGATAVSFGDTAATSFNVVSATSITAVVAGGATGSVSVTTPGGTATLAGFTFISPVQVTASLGTTSGGYTTLKAAFDSINSGYHKGVITIAINENITETAIAELKASGTGTTPFISSYSSITISPNGGVARTISGNLLYKFIFLNGADSVRIDGLNTGGNSLTIDNASTDVNASTLYFDNDASNNIITNCTILGSSTSTGNSATILFGTTCPVTGNDNNNINHCNIGPSGSNLPYCALQYRGGSTVATANSGNTLSYNNIYDWYCPTSTDYAIYFISSYININFTIDHNSFYQTAPRTKTATSGVNSHPMYLTGSSGYGQTITNNYIGGSAAQCGGAAMSYTGAATGNVIFQPIFINMGTSAPTTIKNNTIKNINLTADGDVTLYPITVQAGACKIDNNTIGSATDNANITLNSLTKGCSFYGIYNTSTASISSINNNTIGGITIDGKDASGSYMNGFYGINITSTTSNIDTIKNNLIGSLNTANSVSITNSVGVCRMFYEGIYMAGFSSGVRLIDSNTIANLSIIKDGSRLYADRTGGIYSEVPDATISNNTIYNLKNGFIYSSTPGFNYEYYSPLVGIYLKHASGTTTVSKNKIYALVCTSTTSTVQLPMAGIYKDGNGLAVIDGNFIHGIRTTATTPAGFLIRGISSYLQTPPSPDANLSIKNNIISLGLDETGANIVSNHVYTGIYLNYASTRKIYFNTCCIGGSAATGSCNSYAYFQQYATIEDIRNNIFYNARANTTATGKHYAISSGDATFTTCDYNDYYASGTGGVLGQQYLTDKTSLSSWQATTLGDIHSYTKNPALSNAGGILAANYLPSHPNLVAATGTATTTDYSGTTRSITYPAMGAYDYTVIPLKPVEVTATASTTGPTLYTNLKDAFDAINMGTHKGAITIKINDNTTETASAKLNASGVSTFPGISSYSSVNIYPTATGLSIAGNLAAPLIDLNGADTVTIDGRVNATGSTKDLTITNISTLSTAGTSTVRFINDASYNTVKYCTIKGSTYDANGGVLLFSTGTTTGNIGNHIDNNDITTADNANRPRSTIFSYGTSNSIANSMDTISNNNIYDFLNQRTTSAGIFLSTYSTAWAITANTFYETTAFAPTAANIYYAININNTAGDNFIVTDNYIGGSASDHSGSWSVSALNFAHQFCGINLNVGTTTASSIQNNTIQNMSYSCSAATPWVGISLNAGNINVGTVSGNTIGSKTETNTVVLTNSTSGSVKSYGIYIYNSSIIDIQNNTVGGITTIGSATLAHGFSGINKLASGGITTISNNTVKNITAQSTATSTYEAQSVYGIYSAGSGAVTIANDSIYNLTNNTRNQVSATLGRVQGIVTTAGTNIITGNIVHDLTINNANTSLTNTAPVMGISQSSTTIKQNVSGNTIYNLSNTYVYFSGGVIGLYYTGATTDINTVSGNLIYGLSATSSGTGLYGVKIDGGTTTYSNNIINLNGNNSSHLYGFKDVGGTNNVYFNTVYIYGSTPVGSNLNSFCLHSNGSNVRDYRNNIFVNNRFSSFINPCVRIENLSNLTIDYNDYYYFITAGANQGVGMSSSQIYASLLDFKGYTGQDTHSKNVDPGFASAGGSLAANYLPSQSSLVAATGTGITTDYAGVSTRSLTFPAMGAWEYAVSSAPGLITTDFTGISLNSATTGGNTIVSLGSLVTAKGVVWSVSTAPSISLPTKTSETVTIGSEAADFSSSITGLDVNTKYYVRAYATNNMGTGYADEKNFWTLANVPSAPTVNNPQLTSLDVAVNVNSNPTTTEFAIKAAWGTNIKYVHSGGTLVDTAVWQTATAWGTKTVTGLVNATTYTFSVKAKNGGGDTTVFSSSTSGVPVGAPTVETNDAIPAWGPSFNPDGTASTDWQAVATSDDGKKMLAAKYNGRLYISSDAGKTWGETTPTGTAENKSWSTVAISGNGMKMLAIVGSGRVYLTSDGGTTWSETMPTGVGIDKDWTSPAISADGSVWIISHGGSASQPLYKSIDNGATWTSIKTTPAYGFYASLSSNGSTILAAERGAGVAGRPSKIYKSVDGGTSWAETLPTGTSEDKNWQSVSMSSDGSKMLAAVYAGRIYMTNNGGTLWTEAQPAGNNNKEWYSVAVSADGSCMLAAVPSGRLYKYSNNAWAETQPAGNGNKNWYSVDLSFNGAIMIAAIRYGNLYKAAPSTISNITTVSATGNGIITLTNGANASNRGVIWYPYSGTDKTIGQTNVTNVSETGDFGIGTFTASLTGLSINTHYDARAHATNPSGTAYGERVDFWTLANVPSAPTVNNPQLTSLDVAINANSNPAITKYAILETIGNKYVQSNGTLSTDSVWLTEAEWEINASNTAKTVSGLSENTKYVFKVKAKNDIDIETAFSSTDTLYTLAKAPSAPILTAASSTSLYVAINANGNPATTTFAIKETGGSKYVQANGLLGDNAVWQTEAVWEINATNTAKAVTGLSVNTEYTFKVKARNGNNVETAFSGTTSLYTLANVPSAPILNNPTATSLDVAVVVNSNPSTTVFAIQDSINGTFVQASGAMGVSAIWQTAIIWGTKTISGLSTGVTYYYRVKARNRDSVETTYGLTTAQNTCSNPTTGGSITAAQTICYSTAATALSSVSLPTNYGGTLEYKWQYATVVDSTSFSDILLTDSIGHNPGILTASTWFRRLARVNCKLDWVGAAVSNVIKITVDPTSVGGTISGTATITYGSSTGTMTLSGKTGVIQRWERKVNTGSWTNITNTNATYSESPTSACTMYYRVYVKSGVCSEAYSDVFTVTVNKKDLSITADNKTKVYDGLIYSPFTVSYSGFITGEDYTALGGTLAFGGTSASATDIGTYTIIASGQTSNNYEISYYNGSLLINCAPVVNVVNNVNSGFGSLRNAIANVCDNGTITFASGVDGQTISLTSAALNIDKKITLNNSLHTTGISITGSCDNITINAAKSLTLATNSKVTVIGAIKNNAGVTGLVLNSGASLIQNTVALPATVKRELNNKWHLIGSPFAQSAGATISNITPVGGSTQIKLYTNGTAWSASTTYYMQPLIGYAVCPNITFTASLSGNLYSNPIPTMAYALPLIYTGTSASQSWNLIANPFTSYLNWNLLGKTNVSTTLYLWDNTLSPGLAPSTTATYFRTYNATNGVGVPAGTLPYIAPMQGFFVKASYTSPKLSIPPTARAHSTASFYKEATNTEILVRLKTETETAIDELVVCKSADAKNAFEEFDSEKMLNAMPIEMYTQTPGGEKLIINTINKTNIIIPIGITIANGSKAKITAFGLESAEQVYLEDRLKGKLISLYENTAYEFDFSSEAILGRFFIRFGDINAPLSVSDVKVYTNDHELNIIAQTGEEIQQVEVYSLTGACVYSSKLAGSNVFNSILDLSADIYLVRVKTSLATQNVKVNWK